MLPRRQSSHCWRERAVGADALRPVRQCRTARALKAFLAPGAKAVVVVGIPDVIEVNAVHVVVADDLDHRGDFQLLVVGMGGAEPRLLLAVRIHLQAARLPHLRHELLRRGGPQLPIHLPDVHLHTVLAAGRQALANLVASRRHLGCHRQDLALIERRAAPKHVGQNGGEPVLGQAANGLVPFHPLDPERAVAPKRAELPRERLLRQAEGPQELFARCRGLLCRFGVLLLSDQLQRRPAQRGSCGQRFRHSRILALQAADVVRGVLISLEAGDLPHAQNGGLRQTARGCRRQRFGSPKVAQIELSVHILAAPGRDADGFDLVPTRRFALALRLALINLDGVPVGGRLGEERRLVPTVTALEIDAEVRHRGGIAAQNLELDAPVESQVQFDAAVPRGSLSIAGGKIAGQPQDLAALERSRCRRRRAAHGSPRGSRGRIPAVTAVVNHPRLSGSIRTTGYTGSEYEDEGEREQGTPKGVGGDPVLWLSSGL